MRSMSGGEGVPVGLTRDAGFEIGVSRTVDVDPDAAWGVLLGAGLAVWLGRTDAPLRSGESYRTEDGTVGEVRSLHAGSRLRLTWRPSDWSHDAIVQVTVSPGTRGRAVVNFHTERLAGPRERAALRDRWRGALDALEPMFAGAPPAPTA